ncbi:ornithine cyclodeaminase family protein [Brevibacterium zhoupengii]|uniref:ornithine cyclodeaminase family protein n=1 Tax=Brevibacterium zhoupengii TaxID=2898795 RepID=UPI001F09188B|nr:ornithine cyclodeaminase family protein [Brevibacterium zhoupengii]
MNQPVYGLPYLSADEVRSQMDPDSARRLIEQALLDGFEPATDPARQLVSAGSGHLLLMPSNLDKWVGVKIASVSPDNPNKGLPRIQALYILMDAETLTPQFIVEGSTLTVVRTPATTALAVDRLASEDASKLVVFGSGPQAVDHVIAFSCIRRFTDVRLVGRNPERTATALAKLADLGVSATQGRVADVADADVVLCATSAKEPVFDGDLIKNGACVAAIGSHEPERRELPGDLLARSLVVVEDFSTALREAGDIILAIEEGSTETDRLRVLADLVLGEFTRSSDRPNVFKGTGMSWQDLAVVSGLRIPE